MATGYICRYCKKQSNHFNCDCQKNRKLWNPGLRKAKRNKK